jgi:hypothetical protein
MSNTLYIEKITQPDCVVYLVHDSYAKTFISSDEEMSREDLLAEIFGDPSFEGAAEGSFSNIVFP